MITFFLQIFVYFLPGFFISYLFFDYHKINFIERIVYSFMFSIALVPLILFLINILNIQITPLVVVLIVLGIVVLVFLLKLYFSQKRKMFKCALTNGTKNYEEKF